MALLAAVVAAAVAAVGKNMYTNFMRRIILIAVLSFIFLAPVVAQEVGETTEEILDNVSSQQKPQEVGLEEETCKILGIFNCPQPKVDYTHSDLLPKDVQLEEEGLSFWQQISVFFKNLFDKSADPQTGYGYSYLPKGVNPVSDEVDPNVADISTETAVEQTHETVKKSFLPYNYASKLSPAPTNLAQVPPSGVIPEPTNSAGVPPASGNSTVEYAISLVQTAGQSCGWTTTNVKTRSLSCNNCSVNPAYKPVKISCLQGKVSPEVYIDLSASANGNSWLQCVGFVIGVEQGMGRMLASKNAKDYCLGAVPPGYISVSKNSIQPGDIVANTAGTWGHIMVILEVIQGEGAYRVAEANYNGPGTMTQNRMIYNDNIDCVLRPKNK